jgi:pilus assembly protein CpaE
MSRRTNITALLISPDRRLAAQFRNAIARTRAFDIVAELDSYPKQTVLDGTLRQVRPDVLLLDVATDLDTAGDLIRRASSSRPPLHVIGLHQRNDSQAILKALRDGATEFLFAPFDVSIQEAAVARIQKILEPATEANRERGRVVAFANAKPGSGSSTLAVQTAYALRRIAGRRVLLIDLDVQSGSVGFFLRLDHDHSVIDVLQQRGPIESENWDHSVCNAAGIDVLQAPMLPFTDPIDPTRFQQVLEYARNTYEWTIVDLPAIFTRVSLMCVSAADRAFLVSTSELASLHLTRRAVKLMAHLAFDSSKYQVLVNRLESRSELNSSDLSKLFECHVDKGLPNERLRVERVHTLGQPLDGASDLGRAIEGLATKLLGALPERPTGRTLLTQRPAFSQT